MKKKSIKKIQKNGLSKCRTVVCAMAWLGLVFLKKKEELGTRVIDLIGSIKSS